MLRGMIDKGKTDPKVREKTAGLSIRKLLRSKTVKGQDNRKKNAPMDNKVKGEAKREKARMRQVKKGKGRSLSGKGRKH
jgi:AdoMet-dependent rRNA methyltransferase SPB1